MDTVKVILIGFFGSIISFVLFGLIGWLIFVIVGSVVVYMRSINEEKRKHPCPPRSTPPRDYKP
jgi:Ca2+-dependent lipid-binding protein